MPARLILDTLIELPRIFNLGNGFKTIAQRTAFGLDLLRALDGGKFVGAVKDSPNCHVRFIVVADNRDEALRKVSQVARASGGALISQGFVVDLFTREDVHDFFPPVDEPADPDAVD